MWCILHPHTSVRLKAYKSRHPITHSIYFSGARAVGLKNSIPVMKNQVHDHLGSLLNNSPKINTNEPSPRSSVQNTNLDYFPGMEYPTVDVTLGFPSGLKPLVPTHQRSVVQASN